MSLHAFLDESRRRKDDGSHLYLLSAAILPSEHRVRAERRLRQLVPKGSRRLHFRRDRPPITRRHLTLIAELLDAGELHVVASHARIATARHERRARVRLLAALAARLAHDGVIPAGLLWRHDRPNDEPLLWLPDVLAGVLGGHLLGQEMQGYLGMLPAGTFDQVTDLGEL